MRREDELPVLAFLRRPERPRPEPQPEPHPGSTPEPRPERRSGRADPDDLARAIEALRVAEATTRWRAPAMTGRAVRGDGNEEEEDAFGPVGIPRRRAGPLPPDATSGTASGPAQARPGQTAAAWPAARPDGAPPRAERRMLSLDLPLLAMERHVRDALRRGEVLAEDAPLALAVEGPHGPVIHAVNRAAAQEGVQPGARVVDMRALCPGLRVDFADPGADRAALGRLMLWARRWCPWTATDGTRGLMLDTTGSTHLWGGEAAMLARIEADLAGLGLTARLALAPTQGAAWALARFGGVREICGAAALEARIAPLPVRALRLDGDTVQLLGRLGLKTVGDLAAVPRLSLARRFSREPAGRNPLLRLDQMTGRLAEPLASPDDPPRFAVETRLAEPVLDPVPHIPALAEALCAALGTEGFGARALRLTLFRTDGETVWTEVRTAQASRDAGHLARLFEGRLDGLDPGFGFDLVTLAASVAEALPVQQRRLDGGIEDGAEIARLIDRLSARFGASRLKRPAMRESHLPERRESFVPAMAGSPRPPEPAATERPLRLFEPPEEVRVVYAVPEGPPAQFVWRRVTHRVTRFAGPERIAPEWWADRPGTRLRDYYRIEDHVGRRYWLYREGLHEDGRGGEPRWFVHGAFA